MRKKGQTAMEYLMTYGWAILIVIVVVAALYSMGVFTLAPGVPCSPCFGYFSYIDHDTTNVFVRNGPRQINITTDIYNASDDIIYAHGCTIWPCTDVTITYTITDSEMTHTDTATLHSPG